jgi:protein-tyrosine-phosphatase
MDAPEPARLTRTILFVCSGNICRSPFAEVAARAAIVDEGLVFASAGTMAIDGDHATLPMQEVAAERGLDLSEHRARLLDEVDEPDVVFGMEVEHLVAARRVFPGLPRSAIQLLDHPRAVDDPYGRPPDVYRRVADQIQDALTRTLPPFLR